jgi:hypothetical protein
MLRRDSPWRVPEELCDKNMPRQQHRNHVNCDCSFKNMPREKQMKLTCEGKPWINITEGLSTLPLSTQNHLLNKIIFK